jgi:hypothetical protein
MFIYWIWGTSNYLALKITDFWYVMPCSLVDKYQAEDLKSYPFGLLCRVYINNIYNFICQ